MPANILHWRCRRPGPEDLPGSDSCSRWLREYVARVPDGDIVLTLAKQGQRLAALLRTVPPRRERWAYAEGKWSIREVAGHVSDVERLFAYRALHFARCDQAPLPDMDPDAWALQSGAADRPLRGLLAEFEPLRTSTIALLANLAPGAWDRRGRSGGREGTVRAMAWVMAGHAIHHEEALRRLYGLGTASAGRGRSRKPPGPTGSGRAAPGSR